MCADHLDRARAVLQRYFRYPDFRPMQRHAVQAVLTGRDAVVVLPTGGGKSICFQVPALLRPGLTVVVSPLISLMADQVQALQRRGIAADFLNSTLTSAECARRMSRIEDGETRLLYVAPERLVGGPTPAALARTEVSMLAVDEAHCVSIWGQDFRPSYARLAEVCQRLGSPQTVALTATATPAVRADIVRLLGLRAPLEVVGGFDRPNLRFAVRRVRNERARHRAIAESLAGSAAPAVVYAATRSQVDQVTRTLREGGVRAVAYHGGMPPSRRGEAQDAFMTGRDRVIVATNAFGMGIDKPDVRMVVHYCMSGSLEDYYQEAGRAGRDGEPSHCLLLHHESDRHVHEVLRERAAPPPEAVAELWRSLRSSQEDSLELDAASLSRAIDQRYTPDVVERALALLVDAALVHPHPDDGIRMVRLLATPDRAVTLTPVLSRQAAPLLHRLSACHTSTDTWLRIDSSCSGLAPTALDRSLRELEAQQAVFVAPPVPRGVITQRAGADARLGQLLRALRRRSSAERAKLDAMAGYAVANGCRRHFILRYFGDKYAPARCASCDNCAR